MKYLSILLLSIFITSCMTPLKTLEAGNYKRALQLAVSEVQKNKNVEENLGVIKKSTEVLVAREIYQGNRLMSSRKVSHWVQVQNKYYDLLEKLDLANSVSHGTIDSSYNKLCSEKTALDFQIVDTFYQAGNQYMEVFDQGGQKVEARKAYKEYCACKKHGGEEFFSDLPQQIDVSLSEGTVYYISHGGYSSSSVFLKKLPRDATFEADCEVWYSTSFMDFDESEKTNSTNYFKNIIVDYDRERDTSGNIIRTPVYKDVKATVEVTTVTLTAKQTSKLIVNNITGQCFLSNENHSVSKSDSYEVTEINGDERAVPSSIGEGSDEPSSFKSHLEDEVEKELDSNRSNPTGVFISRLLKSK